jgi:hypothetical protein
VGKTYLVIRMHLCGPKLGAKLQQNPVVGHRAGQYLRQWRPSLIGALAPFLLQTAA